MAQSIAVDDVAREARALGVHHAQVDEVRAGCHTAECGRGRAAARDDAGHVGAVAVEIEPARVRAGEVDRGHHPTAEVAVLGDARVDDGDADAPAAEGCDALDASQDLVGTD